MKTSFLQNNKKNLNNFLRLVLDGSHTRSRTGGESVGYQGRKSTTTDNCIFLFDNQGQMLYLAAPVSGAHHDLYNIKETLEKILSLLNDAEIEHKGLFLNADSGFGSKNFRDMPEQKEIIGNIKYNPLNGETKHEKYFDQEFYKRRSK